MVEQSTHSAGGPKVFGLTPGVIDAADPAITQSPIRAMIARGLTCGTGTRRLKPRGFLITANQLNTNWTGGTDSEVWAPDKTYSPC